MEINRLQMREIAKLAQDAGPPALKGLSNVERKALKLMMEALQKKDHSVSIRGLDEHQFTQLKNYLKEAAKVKQSGHAFTISEERYRGKEKFKGIKNLVRARVGTSSLEKEIDKAMERSRGKGSDVNRKTDEYKRKITAAEKRIATIKAEAGVQERERILGILKPLQKRLREAHRDFDIVLEEKDKVIDRMRAVAREAVHHLPEENLREALEEQLNLSPGISLEQKLPAIASLLKGSPRHVKAFELLQKHKDILDEMMLAGNEQRENILVKAIKEQEDFLSGTRAEMKELEGTIATNKADLEETLKANVGRKTAPPTPRQSKLKQLDKELGQLKSHVQFLSANGANYRQEVNGELRKEWNDIRKNSPETLKGKNLTVRMRSTLKEIRELRKKNDPQSIIRRVELIQHLRNLVKLRRAKTEDEKKSMIKTFLEAPLRKSTAQQDKIEDKLLKQYLKVTETLQKRKSKLETR